jgi:hypothetical protein
VTDIARSDENRPDRPWSGVLVLAVWLGPGGRLAARIRMTTGDAGPLGQSGQSGETVLTTASRAEVLDRVRDFLDSFPGDSGEGATG